MRQLIFRVFCFHKKRITLLLGYTSSRQFPGYVCSCQKSYSLITTGMVADQIVVTVVVVVVFAEIR